MSVEDPSTAFESVGPKWRLKNHSTSETDPAGAMPWFPCVVSLKLVRSEGEGSASDAPSGTDESVFAETCFGQELRARPDGAECESGAGETSC